MKGLCTCKEPTPWEDVKGNKTNICKVCCNRIEHKIEHTPPTLGQVHTRLDATVLGDLELSPNHPFVTHLAETIREDTRLRWRTWSHNRMIEEMNARKAST